MKISILFILLSVLSACGQYAAEIKNQTVEPVQTASATPQPSPSVTKNGNYDGKGVVTKIDLKIVSVELDHEEIKGLMPPMRMEFYVTKKSELEALKLGDAVEFVVEYKDGQEKIISIKKAQ